MLLYMLYCVFIFVCLNFLLMMCCVEFIVWLVWGDVCDNCDVSDVVCLSVICVDL